MTTRELKGLASFSAQDSKVDRHVAIVKMLRSVREVTPDMVREDLARLGDGDLAEEVIEKVFGANS